MEKNLRSVICTAETVGDIKKMNMYDSNSIFVEGITEDGKKFTLTLIIEEGEEKDAE